MAYAEWTSTVWLMATHEYQSRLDPGQPALPLFGQPLTQLRALWDSYAGVIAVELAYVLT